MRLVLDDIGLSSVPVESVAVFKNGRLAEINLRHRELRNLSAEIARLTALTVLDAGANQLRSPLQTISACTTLTVLRLDSNNMYFVPNSIGAMRGLVTLDLSGNEIFSLPISIIALTPDTLRLDNNHLFDISDEIALWADAREPDWRATQRPDKGPSFIGIDPGFH